MKKIRYIVLSGIALVALYGFTLVNTSNPEKDKLLIEIMAYVLERGHYDPVTIDDSFSENVFMNYLEIMDGQHRFYIQADVNNFNQFKTKIDRLAASENAFDLLLKESDNSKSKALKSLEDKYGIYNGIRLSCLPSFETLNKTVIPVYMIMALET